jgi:hypothetical protein
MVAHRGGSLVPSLGGVGDPYMTGAKERLLADYVITRAILNEGLRDEVSRLSERRRTCQHELTAG